MKASSILNTNALALVLALAFPGGATWAHSHGHSHEHGTTPHKSQAPVDLPSSDHVSADGCWIRQLPKPTPSGGFLVVHNKGTESITVEGAFSHDYEDIMLHQTTEDDGISKMSMVHELSIPAGQSVELKPGSFHLMLEGPKEGLAVGDDAHVQLVLSNGTSVLVTCKVMPPQATGIQTPHH